MQEDLLLDRECQNRTRNRELWALTDWVGDCQPLADWVGDSRLLLIGSGTAGLWLIGLGHFRLRCQLSV